VKEVYSEEIVNTAVAIGVYVASFVVLDPKPACVLDMRLNMSVYFTFA